MLNLISDGYCKELKLTFAFIRYNIHLHYYINIIFSSYFICYVRSIHILFSSPNAQGNFVVLQVKVENVLMNSVNIINENINSFIIVFMLFENKRSNQSNKMIVWQGYLPFFTHKLVQIFQRKETL